MTAARVITATLALLAFLSAPALQAGGWVVITLKNVPTHVMAGEGGFIYTVRQHGHSPMNDLTGRVEARKGSRVVRSTARELWGGRLEEIRNGGPGVRSPGAYTFSLRFPEPGLWTVELIAGSGLVGDTLTLPIEVLDEGLAPPQVSEVVRGRQLFAGKGCVTCHQHPEFSDRPSVNVLDMSAKRYTYAYVQSFLLSVPPAPVDPSGPRKMPNLGLARHEVESLAAFLAR